MEISKTDYLYNKVKQIIENNNLLDGIDRFILLFSCGKDCSLLLDIILRYFEEQPIDKPLDIFSVLYPKHMYYKNNLINDNFLEIHEYWEKRNVKIVYRTPTDDDFADDEKEGCLTCKKSRKSLIDPFISNYDIRTGMLTGFTMNDILAYVNMLLLNTNFDLNNYHTMIGPDKVRMEKMLHKLCLKERLPNNKYMIRPILPLNEIEVKEYLEERKIPYLTTPCKISKYKFKRLYSRCLDLYNPFPVTYEGVIKFLKSYNININESELPFENMIEDNYFIDC